MSMSTTYGDNDMNEESPDYLAYEMQQDFLNQQTATQVK